MNKKEIKVRLSCSELDSLNENVAKTGLSRENYLRLLLTDRVPVELPPADYRTILRQLSRLETEVSAIAGEPSDKNFNLRLAAAVQSINSTMLMMQTVLIPQQLSPFSPEESEVSRSA